MSEEHINPQTPQAVALEMAKFIIQAEGQLGANYKDPKEYRKAFLSLYGECIRTTLQEE